MGCRHQPNEQTVRRVNLTIDQVDWFRKRCPDANPNTQVKRKFVQEKERQRENLSSPMTPKSIFKNRLACVQVRPGVLAQTAARMNGRLYPSGSSAAMTAARVQARPILRGVTTGQAGPLAKTRLSPADRERQIIDGAIAHFSEVGFSG